VNPYPYGEHGRALGGGRGKNYLAQRIPQRAIENQVPIIENPPLAQALLRPQLSA
jgi:type III secretion system FlhB-like substrate exporter